MGSRGRICKQAIVELRQAIARADWPAMSRMLPPGTPWFEGIEKLVKGQKPDDQSYSFWRVGSEIPIDSLRIRVQGDGSVTVYAPLFVRGERGEWDAVLKRANDGWQLASTRESWGRQ